VLFEDLVCRGDGGEGRHQLVEQMAARSRMQRQLGQQCDEPRPGLRQELFLGNLFGIGRHRVDEYSDVLPICLERFRFMRLPKVSCHGVPPLQQRRPDEPHTACQKEASQNTLINCLRFQAMVRAISPKERGLLNVSR
jgi:hypothetical protein